MKMNLYKMSNKIYEQYEVGTTDFIIEVCEEPTDSKYIEVWLYRLGYGIKQLMFCIEKTDDYQEIIKSNVYDYIKLYEESVTE